MTRRPTGGATTRRHRAILGTLVLLFLVSVGLTPGPATATLPVATSPVRAAFFYPWFPKGWSQQRTNPFTNFTPSLGYYDSADRSVVDEQLKAASAIGLDAFIASWWGRDHHTDLAMKQILPWSGRADSPSPGLKWAMYYESESLGDPSVAEITADLRYLASTYFARPNYLRVDGRPVLFVYSEGKDRADLAARWAEAKAEVGGDLYVVLKVYPGYKNDPNQPDSWHQYAPANAYDAQLPYSVNVSAGFWKKGEAPRLARDAAAFEAGVRKMAASGAAWQLITSWNEWGEGTSIEPAAEFGNSYLEAACRGLGVASNCDALASVTAPSVATAREDAGTAPRAPPFPSALAPQPPQASTAPSDPAERNRSVVVAAAGDIACGFDSGRAPCRQEATAQLLADMDPEVVLALGDLQYEKGQLDNFMASYDPTWGRFKARTRPVVGNHEYLTRKASGYFDYFNGIDNATGPAGDRTKGYYSFDVGAWHLVALNSNCNQVGGCGAGSPQERWLREDLAANPTACSLIYMHHPLWSSDRREFDTVALRPLFQAFYESGGELALVGHSHFYERFAPQDPNGRLDLERGIRQLIVGTGGRNTYGFGPTRDNSEVRAGPAFGVLRLSLNPTSYDWRFEPLPGQPSVDSGSADCH